jgi:pyruvate/2-oxoacid:ferredoxin oxidoreductase beta subunit
MVKEMFFNNTTGVAVVNVGDAPTKFYASYTDQNGVLREFETVDTVAPGAAVSFFKVFTNPGGKFTGLTNFGDLEGTKNSVSISGDGVQPIVALAQESDQYSMDGVLDVKNYEGFIIP